MKEKIIDISDQYLIAASDDPEIFKIVNHTPGNFGEVLSELEDFNPKQDKIYLPKEALTEKAEIFLTDIHPYAYELPPFNGQYKKTTRAVISISPYKHSKDLDHPFFKDIYEWSLKNYPNLTKYYYNEEYIDGVFVTYWNPGTFTVPNDPVHRPLYLNNYFDLVEQFDESKDYEIYFYEDEAKEKIGLIQRHSKGMSWEKYKLNNPIEIKEWQENRDKKFGTPGMLTQSYEEMMATSNLVRIEAEDVSAEDLVKSIYYHDGTPAWKAKENKGIKDELLLTIPPKFNKKSADKITNFNPSADTLEIEFESFGIDRSATFAAGKNKKAVKKKLAKQDFDFLYDEKKGGLYFNENGADKGFGDGGIIAILKGAPDLTSGNLEFI